ncbi:mitochondrial carrier domain-containing protein [Gloeopeniophorella convolvens]|nr:mitochondrial carrier domain-containing protein [Gloeopeniophorella convolvens]
MHPRQLRAAVPRWVASSLAAPRIADAPTADRLGVPAAPRGAEAANDFRGKTFKTLSGEAEITQKLSILTGCSARATESFVVVPFELSLTRSSGRLQDTSSTYGSLLDVVRQIVCKEGLLGLYSGMEATFWWHLWWNGGYFGTIFQVKAALPGAEVRRSAPRAHGRSELGPPPDVVKRGAGKIPGVVPKYDWTYPGIVTTFREEDLTALYKGFVPKMLRLVPGGGVLLLMVEFTLSMFRKALGPPYIYLR